MGFHWQTALRVCSVRTLQRAALALLLPSVRVTPSRNRSRSICVPRIAPITTTLARSVSVLSGARSVLRAPRPRFAGEWLRAKGCERTQRFHRRGAAAAAMPIVLVPNGARVSVLLKPSCATLCPLRPCSPSVSMLRGTDASCVAFVLVRATVSKSVRVSECVRLFCD